MGKGDKKSKKGKIFMGSYGVVRPRKASTGQPLVKAGSTKVAETTEAAKKPTVKRAKKAATKE